MTKLFLLIFIISHLWIQTVLASSLATRQDVNDFIDEMVSEHKMDKSYLQTLFNKTEIKQNIIDLMNRPAEKVTPWYDYKKIFLTDSRLKKGLDFWKENKDALAYAREIYGVPEEIVVAIIGVETFYGKITGKHRVIDALSTLAFDYPKRSVFFRKELKHFLVLCKQQSIDPLSIKGSYAGAMGYGQFMPSSYQNYAVDFDGQGIKDIWNNPNDAIGSVANYFKQHGWILDQPVITKAIITPGKEPVEVNNKKLKPETSLKDFSKQQINSDLSEKFPEMKAAIVEFEEKSGSTYWLAFKNFYAISRYNHSHMYSMVVYLLSQDLKRSFNEK